jgi:hypothetical protein
MPVPTVFVIFALPLIVSALTIVGLSALESAQRRGPAAPQNADEENEPLTSPTK